MRKEEKFRQRFIINGVEKVYYPKSQEQREKNIETAKAKGYKVIENVKLYPFSTIKNQHNFELISNRCFNIMHDMEVGVIPYDEQEYERLYEMREKAQQYFCLELPVAWVDYQTLCECKNLSLTAINWRIDRCIEKGRNDLIRYCY